MKSRPQRRDLSPVTFVLEERTREWLIGTVLQQSSILHAVKLTFILHYRRFDATHIRCRGLVADFRILLASRRNHTTIFNHENYLFIAHPWSFALARPLSTSLRCFVLIFVLLFFPLKSPSLLVPVPRAGTDRLFFDVGQGRIP